ncbi:MAG: translation initiation factor IF-3 [Flavobacteriales bacterium]|nr:translation initiation factor IF-3 [Flavobacteriales bacterium]
MVVKRRHKGRRPWRIKKENPHKINDFITANTIRLVGDNVEPKVCAKTEGMNIAKELGLDLVEISGKSDPPVCKIIDYKKFLYAQKKKQKEIKSKSSKIVVKEIRFGPNTEEHDYNFKLNHAKKFLEDGSKLKAYVFFKGRSIIHKDRGEILLLKLAQDLEQIAKVDELPKLEGKRMIMMLSSLIKK